MFELLTQYLTRAKTVTIPHLGSLTLEIDPASWSVSDRLLAGPRFHVRAGAEQPVDAGQIAFLAGALQETESSLTEQLAAFGKALQRQLTREPFFWPGVGVLQWQDDQLVLGEPAVMPLAPQPADRVIHADARHSIRVGEQEHWSDDDRVAEGTVPRRMELEWLAWLLVVLAALFILWSFYDGGFSVHASGLQTNVSSSLP